MSSRDNCPAQRRDVIGDSCSDLARAERLRALGPVALQGVSQLREAERLALGQDAAGGRIEPAALLIEGEDWSEDVEDVGLLGVERSAVEGQIDRRPHQLRKWSGAETIEGMGEARRGARHAARGGADVECLRHLVEVDLDRNQLCAPLDPPQARRLDEEVDQDRITARRLLSFASGGGGVVPTLLSSSLTTGVVGRA